ncbi:hypothetical protein [Moorena sp. SIO3F7]|nr:hypothetical protein [Moorena sp. SIO3F7]NEO16565.1 hypothetical protein [Moorena sp. SIO3E8]NEQ03095.1 hypothetical protein [Moorena sp. SIO3F7]
MEQRSWLMTSCGQPIIHKRDSAKPFAKLPLKAIGRRPRYAMKQSFR